LSLALHGLPGVDARRLAEALGRELSANGHRLGGGALSALRVDVSPERATSIEELSRKIADQVLSALARQT
jgi:hypothetical protein